MDKNTDKRLGEQISTLDTLSVGIVYDKDGAWDKLQARLETKPAKKIKLFYWLVAAAVLLVCLIMIVPRNNKKEIAINAKEQFAQPHQNVQPKQSLVPMISSVHKTQPRPIMQYVLRSAKRKNSRLEEKTNVAFDKLPLAVVYHTNDKTVVVLASANKPVAVIKKMKVISINDLDDTEQPLAGNRPGQKDNSAINFTVFKTSSENATSIDNSEAYNAPAKSFRIKLN